MGEEVVVVVYVDFLQHIYLSKYSLTLCVGFQIWCLVSNSALLSHISHRFSTRARNLIFPTIRPTPPPSFRAIRISLSQFR
nr:hypothetical protein HmN_000907300 [Hymenolepis microstoma]